jgi:hypothetical protein
VPRLSGGTLRLESIAFGLEIDMLYAAAGIES